jgi:hypothetical protein
MGIGGNMKYQYKIRKNYPMGLHATVGPGQTAEAVITDLDAFMLKMRKERIQNNRKEA